MSGDQCSYGQTKELMVNRQPVSTPLIEVKKVSKSFGGVRALNKVNFAMYYHEIVGLVGDNGAGKSTLIKVIAGAHPKDEGDILFEGEKVVTHTPRVMRELGIETVYQDLALFNELDVTTNFYFGREITNRIGLLRRKEMDREVAKFVRSFGININSVQQQVGTLSGGQRHSISIGRAVYKRNPKLIILDEPTAGLGVEQSRNVLKLIGELKERGISVILISHNMDHIMTVCDRVVVLRSGTVALVERIENIDTEKLLKAMLGKGP